MVEDPGPAGSRVWGWLVGAFAIAFLVVVGLAMWSERQDAERLPPAELERRGEEPWAPEPVDSPALPQSMAPHAE